MAFDMGFDFRLTSGFVTDAAFGVPVLGEIFPNTYTNGNGFSINAGWDVAPSQTADRANTNDPRIAGINTNPAGATGNIFTVDLSSGSAPGTGIYTIDIAAGDATNFRISSYKLFDNTTLLIDGSNGGLGTATPGGTYLDATVASVAASTTWTGTTVNKTFATTTVKLSNNPDSINTTTCIAHFRLTAPSAATANKLRSMLMLMGVGS